MHKLRNKIGPPECMNLFTLVNETHTIATRAATDDVMVISQCKLRLTEHDFAVKGSRIWKHVPTDIHGIESHQQFKKEIKKVNFN